MKLIPIQKQVPLDFVGLDSCYFNWFLSERHLLIHLDHYDERNCIPIMHIALSQWVSEQNPCFDWSAQKMETQVFHIPESECCGRIYDIHFLKKTYYCRAANDFLVQISLDLNEISYTTPIHLPPFGGIKSLFPSPSETYLAILGEGSLCIYDADLNKEMAFCQFYENYYHIFHWAGFLNENRFSVVSTSSPRGTHSDVFTDVVLFDFGIVNQQLQLQEVIDLPGGEVYWIQPLEEGKLLVLQSTRLFIPTMEIGYNASLPQALLYLPLKKRWEYLYTLPQHTRILAIHALSSEEILILAVDHPALREKQDWLCYDCVDGSRMAVKIHDGPRESIVPEHELVVYQLQLLSGQCEEKFRTPLDRIRVMKAMINQLYFVIHGWSMSNDKHHFTDIFRIYRF